MESITHEILGMLAPRLGREAFVQGEPQRVSSGLSGADVFRILNNAETAPWGWALRGWPPGVSRARVLEIHTKLRELQLGGIEFIAAPVAWQDGSTVQVIQGRCWDLSPWLPGNSELSATAPGDRWEQVGAAVARMHALWRMRCPSAHAGTRPRSSREDMVMSHSGSSRLEFGRVMQAGRIQELVEQSREQATFVSKLAVRTAELAALRLPGLLLRLRYACEACEQDAHALQTIHGDLRSDHVLFVEGMLTGIVDYDAIRTDHGVCDLARVLEPLPEKSHAGWQACLHGYQSAGDLLDENQLDLLSSLHALNPLIGLLQWLDWAILQRREFATSEAGIRRMRELASHLGIVPEVDR